MKSIITIFTILVTSLALSQDTKSPQIGIKIDLGESVKVGAVTITFAELLEDSRCPEGVQCVWAGRARVLVEVSEEGKETYQKEIIIGQITAGESRDRRFYFGDTKALEAFAVTPYPKYMVKTEGYRLLIRETGLD